MYNVFSATVGRLFIVAIGPALVADENLPSIKSGMASIYSVDSGASTASGERLDPAALTAAHRTLPFGTKVRVTNQNNGRSVVVTINDRGPFVRGRVIDLTPAAARAIGFAGVAPVTIKIGE
jgi:rare lipoprotein A